MNYKVPICRPQYADGVHRASDEVEENITVNNAESLEEAIETALKITEIKHGYVLSFLVKELP